MNAQNAKDYLPLVQALADGKTLQFHEESGDWRDCNGEFLFLDNLSRYRIKSERKMREWWLVPGVTDALAVDNLAKARQYTSDDARITHVREVID